MYVFVKAKWRKYNDWFGIILDIPRWQKAHTINWDIIHTSMGVRDFRQPVKMTGNVSISEISYFTLLNHGHDF